MWHMMTSDVGKEKKKKCYLLPESYLSVCPFYKGIPRDLVNS